MIFEWKQRLSGSPALLWVLVGLNGLGAALDLVAYVLALLAGNMTAAFGEGALVVFNVYIWLAINGLAPWPQYRATFLYPIDNPDPLSTENPLVTAGARCLFCHQPFEAEERISLVPVVHRGVHPQQRIPVVAAHTGCLAAFAQVTTASQS